MAIKSIGIDIREVSSESTGKGRYAEEIIKAMTAAAPETQFFLFTDLPNPIFPDVGGVKQILIPARGLRWHFALRKYLLAHPVDFYFSPTSYIYPAIAPKTQKVGIVVHDMVAFLHSKNHHWFPVLVEKLTLGRAVKNAAFITTISKSTWNDLNKIKPASANKKMVLAPPAVTSNFKKVENKTLVLPEKFILAVGTLEPRKNLISLIKAFSNIAEGHGDLHLCIAGGIGWKTAGIPKAIPPKLASRIHFLGYVEYSKLAELYSRAALLAYPSLYEGFGIPPLEAMACGTPVLTSNISSLPEVVGAAAVTVDPRNIDEIAAGIEELLKNPAPYIQKGLERVKLFSWEKSAKEILKAI
ncbi:glycosyltransferase family 4 protein [Candidatus Peregrinibacteria bacterium]|nr:glycosyltransferase family 4 protein [Candidatus Peregrinibacteria bacterium]